MPAMVPDAAYQELFKHFQATPLQLTPSEIFLFNNLEHILVERCLLPAETLADGE